MFKNGLKNFFINLKFFFVPILAMLLGLAIGVAIFIPCARNAVKNSVQDVNEVAEMQVDFDAMWESMSDSIKDLNWQNPSEAIDLVVNKDWFSDTLKVAVNAALGENADGLQDDLPQIAATASQSVKSALTLLVVFVILGIVGGNYLTAFLIRRKIAKRAFWKIFLAYIVDAIINIAMVVLCAWLSVLWSYSIIFTLIAVAIISAFMSLIEAYVLQGWGKVGFKKIVNIKNAVQYLLCTTLIWAMVAAVVTAIHYALFSLVAIVVGVALVEIALAVNRLNAEAYVKSNVDE